jgi:serine/threonine-protein kinase
MRAPSSGESEARQDRAAAGGEGEAPPRRLGRYQILGRLADGGMAEVLLARATGPGGFQRELVIKRLAPRLAGDAAARRMFLDEARLSAALRHPHVVAVLEVEDGEHGAFMAMELLHGHDLRAVARRLAARRRRWPLPLALHVVQAACLGLDHAHEQADARGRPLGIGRAHV